MSLPTVTKANIEGFIDLYQSNKVEVNLFDEFVQSQPELYNQVLKVYTNPIMAQYILSALAASFKMVERQIEINEWEST